MTTCTRRAAVLGGLLVACARGPRDGSILAPGREEHWAAKLFGRPVEARLVKRVPGVVPPHDVRPLFRSFQAGTWDEWPKPTRDARHTEVYYGGPREWIALFSGVPPADPRSDGWKDLGRGPRGVWELQHRAYADKRIFVLADGVTWVGAIGVIALRLSTRFADGAVDMPLSNPKPDALFVQEVRVDTRYERALGSTAILHADQIEGVTVATYAAPPGADVPISVELHFPSSDLAQRAGADLARLLAAARERPYDAFQEFLARAVVGSEGERLYLRGPYRLRDLVSWTRLG